MLNEIGDRDQGKGGHHLLVTYEDEWRGGVSARKHLDVDTSQSTQRIRY